MNRRNIQLPIDELVARYEAGESTPMLGRAYGVGYETVRGRLRAAGAKMRPRGFPLGHTYARRPGGPLHEFGGGYLGTLDRNGKRCLVHRGCYEARHGPIPRGHVVHHINEDPLDNRIENLACMSRLDHARAHSPKEATDGKA